MGSSTLFGSMICMVVLCVNTLGGALVFAGEVRPPGPGRFSAIFFAGSRPDRNAAVSHERLAERSRMVRTIHGYGLTAPDVLDAMGRVPRHAFVPPEYSDKAYADTPLPIGYGQTISQPFIVAKMTALLNLTATSKVLEIGTGSGYQAAILSCFTPKVYTIEIIRPLAESARKRLRRLGYDTVKTRRGDGYRGWPGEAPFDAIVVTAAAGEIPPPLIAQLSPGGRMVIPVGPVFGTQSLMLVEKNAAGKVRTKSLMAVRFVPLTRSDGSGN